MKWNLSSFKYSTLSYYLSKLLGLAPFTVTNNRFYTPTVFGKIYLFFFAMSYLLSLIPPLATPQTTNREYDRIIFKVGDGIRYLVNVLSVFSTPVTAMIMHEKIVRYMNNMCDITMKFKNLGIVEDYENSFKYFFGSTVMANTALVGIFAIVYVLQPNWTISNFISHCVTNWISFNTLLIFSQILICLKERFRLLNQEFYGLVTPSGRSRRPKDSWIFFVNQNAREEDESNPGSLTDLQRIRMIRVLHLELRKMVEQTTHIFATPILMNTLRYSVEYMLTFYWLYIKLQDSTWDESQNISSILFRIFVKAVALNIMMYASDTTCEHGNDTKHVLCAVCIEVESPELQEECFVFSNQLMNTPVTVSAFGFLDLDYSFILKIICLVLTYVVIMIQLD